MNQPAETYHLLKPPQNTRDGAAVARARVAATVAIRALRAVAGIEKTRAHVARVLEILT